MDGKVKNWIRDKFIYSGITKEEYKEVYGELQRKNKNSLQKYSVVGGVLFLCMMIASVFVKSIHGNFWLYLGASVCMFCIFGVAFVLDQIMENTTLPMCYVFLTAVYGYAIAVGTVKQPEVLAVTFCVLLCVGPILFVEQPYRVSIMQMIVTVVFCLLAYRFKSPELAQLDCVNAISFFVLGIIINIHVMQTKMNGLTQYRCVSRARDTDGLTKLMTKAAAEREVKGYMLATGQPAVLLILDIDDFKSVNDTYGHTYGDVVLRTVGQCICQVFRETDVKGRFGGDEFVVFLTNMNQREIVVKRVEMLVNLIKSKLELPDNTGEIHGSIGIALYPEHACTYEELFRCADEALYESKKHGKNCYTFYLDFPRTPMYKKDEK